MGLQAPLTHDSGIRGRPGPANPPFPIPCCPASHCDSLFRFSTLATFAVGEAPAPSGALLRAPAVELPVLNRRVLTVNRWLLAVTCCQY